MASKTRQALTTPSGRPAAFGNRLRERIDSTMIVDKLQGFIAGSIDKKTGKPVHMTQTQVNAARILLNRTCPELKVVSVQHDHGREVKEIKSDDLLAIIEGTAKRLETKQDKG